MNMCEKVYCVDNYWDMTILEGIAEYENNKYFFNCIFSDDNNDWTDIYELTLLDNFIFDISIENWNYWKQWLDGFNKKNYKIPHPATYAESREKLTVKEIFDDKNIEKELMESTEKYYQNKIIIEDYLKNNKPKYKARGIFYGKINGMDTKVIWENIMEK